MLLRPAIRRAGRRGLRREAGAIVPSAPTVRMGRKPAFLTIVEIYQAADGPSADVEGVVVRGCARPNGQDVRPVALLGGSNVDVPL